MASVVTAPITEDRDAPRSRCCHDVYIEVIGDDPYPAGLMNISVSGFQAMVDGRVVAGSMVRLQFSREREADAIVIWQKGTIIGCQFVEPLTRTAAKAIVQGFGLATYGLPGFGYGDASGPSR